jgi:nicotinate-nucleotide--dimethylbenzimidazole phosphoribosyltransferase
VIRFEVPAPEPVRRADRSLGRLAPALDWLASVQGGWPPRVPSAVVRGVVDAGTTGELADGVRRADELADGGCDLLLVGADLDPVPGLVALAAVLGLEPVTAVGTAAGPDWAALTTGVRDGLRTASRRAGEPTFLLRAVDCAPLTVLTGVLAQSAVRRTPVLLDGSPVTIAAAVLAGRMARGSSAWWQPGQVPPSPAGRQGLTELGRPGLLDLGLAVPFGVDLARTVLESAVGRVSDPDGG